MSDPSQITTHDELRVAVFALVPHAQDRAVEQRTGLGKSTVNALRNGRRKFTRDSLDKIVRAYDADRRDEWLAAWLRARTPTSTTTATTPPPHPDAPPGPRPEASFPEASLPEPGARQADAPEAELPPSTITTRTTPEAPPPPEPPPSLVARLRTRAGWAVVGVLVTLAVLSFSHRSVVEKHDVLIAAPGFACPDPRYATYAPVTSDTGAWREDLSVVKMSYAVQPDGTIDVTGGLSGPLPSGAHLFLATWPDPATGPATGPASGRYYPTREIAVTNGTCFQAPRHTLHPARSGATKVRELVVLVRRGAGIFAQDAGSGWTYTDLHTRDASVLGWITVPAA